MKLSPPSSIIIEQLVRFALEEDIGSGDITAHLITADTEVQAKIIAREAGVLCGRPWAEEVIRQIDDTLQHAWQLEDGDSFSAGDVLVTLSGLGRSIMTAERCMLNFLQTLSATATQTAALAALISHTKASLLDTRKTIPGLRQAQKYAVRTGGGKNHRMGLYDAFLIKENHIAACGGISAAITTARAQAAGKSVEIEVQNLDELDQALAAQPDTIMLDNFSLGNLRKAVEINAGRCVLEASGGVDEDSLVSIAETGVDCISIGALTKHCRAIDLSLLIQE